MYAKGQHLKGVDLRLFEQVKAEVVSSQLSSAFSVLTSLSPLAITLACSITHAMACCLSCCCRSDNRLLQMRIHRDAMRAASVCHCCGRPMCLPLVSTTSSRFCCRCTSMGTS